MRGMTLGLAAIVLAAVHLPLVAQDEGAPITLPRLKKSQNVIVEEINRSSIVLPTKPVAWVDGESITQADLLWHLLSNNLGQISKNLLESKLVELEMKRNGVTVSPEEVRAELEEMLPKIAPGQTMEELLSSGLYSKAYLEDMARISRGRKKVFWKAKNIPEDQRANEANPFLMQIWMNEIKNKYQMSVRGQKPAPPKGALAALTTIIDGKKVSYVVTPEEAMKFLVGVLRPAAIVRGLDEAIDSFLVEREMKKHGVKVTDSEIEGWAREMRAKYEGPFSWDMILRLQGLTPDAARRRWRDVQAWKRCNGITITDADIQKFRQENEDYFRTRTVKVRHVLCKFIDDATGLSSGPEAEAKALQRAERIASLAEEGVEFQKLAEFYSDDLASRKNGGMINQPIKKWGGGYDPAFQKAAYALHRGEISKPVKSSFGYHVIYCEEESPPTSRDIDWTNPRYADWITEEYENYMAKRWTESLRAKADIKKVSTDELFELKNAEFKSK